MLVSCYLHKIACKTGSIWKGILLMLFLSQEHWLFCNAFCDSQLLLSSFLLCKWLAFLWHFNVIDPHLRNMLCENNYQEIFWIYTLSLIPYTQCMMWTLLLFSSCFVSLILCLLLLSLCEDTNICITKSCHLPIWTKKMSLLFKNEKDLIFKSWTQGHFPIIGMLFGLDLKVNTVWHFPVG